MSFFKNICKLVFVYATTSSIAPSKAQVANYIDNGSFEEHYLCVPYYYSSLAKHWLSIDSASYSGNYRSNCDMSVPLNANTYQFPKSGKAYILCGFYCLLPECGRGYLKNRLKQNLQPGKTYCVKFHINIANTSPRGMDGFGIYFGNNDMDTISNCNIPLSFINPQVKNPLGNVISDTLNWVPITGSFVANGTEKYALIGNFLADTVVTTSPIFTQSYPQYWTDVCIDDVSCIELNAPAYAGPDQSCIAGDSVFIGREPDFAIDPGCIWYQLPYTPPIDTVSGLWVKPVGTTTYVVRQELECSPLKWDTVVIYANPTGIESFKFLVSSLTLYPIPADEVLNVKLEMLNDTGEKSFEMIIYNSLGQIIKEEEISFKDKTVKINTGEFLEGVYQLQLKGPSTHFDQLSGGSSGQADKLQTVSKRFVISR